MTVFRKKIASFILVVFTIIIIPAGFVLAATGINKQIPYQGVLQDSAGANVSDGSYDMVFRIYDASTSGTTLWTGTYTAANGNAVSVSSGLFRVLLGSGTGNTMTLDFTDDTYWLGVTVGSDSEMTPRQRIGATGYAFNADTIDGAHASSFLTLANWFATTTAPQLTTLLGLTNASSTLLTVTGNSYLGTIATGTWNGDTVGEIYGGTGQSAYVVGDILYADGENSLSRLATSTAGSVLQLDFTTGLPSYVATSTLKFALSDTTGTLAVARGGTGSTTPSNFLFGDGSGSLISTSTIAQNYIDSALARTSDVLTLSNWFATTTAPQLSTLLGLSNASSTQLSVSGESWFVGTTTAGIVNITDSIVLQDNTPSITSNTLYSNSGTLYWNGSAFDAAAGGTEGQTIVINSGGTQSATSTLFITNVGNVGVGMSTPTEKLDVNGNINIASGSYYKVGGSNFAINNLADAQKNTTDNNLFLGHGGGSVGAADDYNLAVGITALDALNNSGADYNVAVGPSALTSNTSGSSNTSIGVGSLQNNTSGSFNTAQGISVMSSNTDGSYNSAYGSYALLSNSSGIYNSALGYESLYANNDGNMNVAMGYQSGRYILDGVTANTTGDLSVFLGAKSRPKADNESNQIVIGYNAIGLGSNTVVLGNDNITTTALKGKVGIGGTSPGAELTVYGDTLLNGSGRYVNFGTATSSSGYGFRDNSGVLEFKNSGGSWASILTYMFTDGGTATYLTSQTDDIAFGGTDNSSPFYFDESAELLTLTNTTAGNSFRVNDQSSDTSPFVVDASGNVGIGTTSPVYKLDIVGTLKASGATTISNSLTVNNSGYGQATFKTSGTNDRTSLITIENNNTSSTAWQIGVGGTGNGLGLTGGEFYLYDVSAQSKPTRFMIDSSGNVGIGGITSPTAKLHIDDNGTASGARFLQIGDDVFLTDIDTANTLGLYGVSDNTVGVIKLGSAGPTLYGKSGNLGIGTTDPDGLEIDIAVTETAQSRDNVRLGVANGTPRIIFEDSGFTQWQIDNSAGSLRLLQPGSVKFMIANSGNVGIGTTNPGKKLEVSGGIRAAGGVLYSGESGYSFYGSGGDTDGGMFSPADGTLVFATNGTERMRIDSSGRVGIGVSPSVDLAIGDNDSGLDSVGDGTLELYTNGTQAIIMNGNQMAFPKLAEWDSNDRILCYKRSGGFTYGQVSYGGDGTDCYPSSIRYKKDIEDLTWGIDELIQLRPVKYKYKDGDKEALGFIAEEVYDTDLKWFVNFNKNGQVESLKSRYYPALIVKAIQDVWNKVTGNSDEIEDLKQKNQELEDRIKVLEDVISSLTKQSGNSSNNFSQNSNAGGTNNENSNIENINQNKEEQNNVNFEEDARDGEYKNIKEENQSGDQNDSSDESVVNDDIQHNQEEQNQNNQNTQEVEPDTSNTQQQEQDSLSDTEKQAQDEWVVDMQEALQDDRVSGDLSQYDNNTTTESQETVFAEERVGEDESQDLSETVLVEADEVSDDVNAE